MVEVPLMAGPIPLERWLCEEEGFAWIPGARESSDAGERERAARALAALDRGLRRILAQEAGRGWVRHRKVSYFLLVEEAREELQVMTLGRSMSWLDEPSATPDPAPPASASPLPPIRRSAGYYGR